MLNSWSLNDTFAVILTGITVVFVALMILILIINLMGKLVVSVKDKEEKNKPIQQPPTEPEPEPISLQETTLQTLEEEVVPEEDFDEVTVAISAAVAVIMGEEAAGTYKITSIKKLPQKVRSAWAKAGILENTQPF